MKEIKVELENDIYFQQALRNQEIMYEGNNLQDPFLRMIYNHIDSPNFPSSKDWEIIIPISGGTDSLCAYHFAKKHFKQIKLFTFSYGNKYNEIELQRIRELTENNIFYHLDLREYYKNLTQKLEDVWGVIFPGRNWLIMVAASSLIEKQGSIWLAAHSGEWKILWSDKSIYMIIEGTKRLTRIRKKPIYLELPFFHVTKGQLIKSYLNTGGNKELLLKTISCHYPVYKRNNVYHCGICNGCHLRYIAMCINNIEEEYNISEKELRKNAIKHWRDLFSDPYTTILSSNKIREIEQILGDIF